MEPDAASHQVLFAALQRGRIRWLLIGRQALIHHGAPLQTIDYDLWVDPAPGNLSRFLSIARELRFEVPRSLDQTAARPMFSAYGGLLHVDVFKVRSFTNLDGASLSFANAWKRRVISSAPGDPLRIPLPSLDDLRLLKRMRDTEKDREDLRYLDLLAKRKKR